MNKKNAHAPATEVSIDVEALGRDIGDALICLADADMLKDVRTQIEESFAKPIPPAGFVSICLRQQQRRLNALFALGTLARPKNLRELLIIQSMAYQFRGMGHSVKECMTEDEYDHICEDYDLIINAALHELAGVSNAAMASAGMLALTARDLPPQYINASLKDARAAILGN